MRDGLCSGFEGKREGKEKENSGKKDLKSFLPYLCMCREEGEQC